MKGTAKATEQAGTGLSDLISRAMEEKNLSIRGLAEKLDLTYEHTRRIVRGENVPSNIILRVLCKELNLDWDLLSRMAVASKITEKYGTIPMEIAGKNPEIEPIERAWPYLTDTQKNSAISMIRAWADGNR